MERHARQIEIEPQACNIKIERCACQSRKNAA